MERPLSAGNIIVPGYNQNKKGEEMQFEIPPEWRELYARAQDQDKLVFARNLAGIVFHKAHPNSRIYTGEALFRLVDADIPRVIGAGLDAAFIKLDGDGLKAHNATFGHTGTDRLIDVGARAMASELRDGDLFGRSYEAGDEFDIYLPLGAEGDRRGRDSARVEVARLEQKVRDAFGNAMRQAVLEGAVVPLPTMKDFNPYSYNPTISCAVVFLNDFKEPPTAQEMHDNADALLTLQKSHGIRDAACYVRSA